MQVIPPNGKQLLKYLSEQLTAEFGAGFDESNLRKMRQLYLSFQIRDTLCPELSWSHYRLLMRIEDESRRDFYLAECAECNWSVRQLERQINSFFYEWLLATQSEEKAAVKGEIQTLEPNTDPRHILKDPYILEFLNLKQNNAYYEKALEQGLLDNLQEFLLELGKGVLTDKYYADKANDELKAAEEVQDFAADVIAIVDSMVYSCLVKLSYLTKSYKISQRRQHDNQRIYQPGN